MTHPTGPGPRPDLRQPQTATSSTPPAVTIISFGYGHGPAPRAHLTADLREHFRDPHADPALRELTAADPRVMAAVLATPGIPRLVSAIVSAARACIDGPACAPLTVAIGCAGGRHRAAAVAITVTRMLASAGIPAVLTHRDIDRPVIGRAPAPCP